MINQSIILLSIALTKRQAFCVAAISIGAPIQRTANPLSIKLFRKLPQVKKRPVKTPEINAAPRKLAVHRYLFRVVAKFFHFPKLFFFLECGKA